MEELEKEIEKRDATIQELRDKISSKDSQIEAFKEALNDIKDTAYLAL